MASLHTEIASGQLTETLDALKGVSCDPVTAVNGTAAGFCVPFAFVHTQCHARAEYICQELERMHEVTTGKVWLFGDLSISPPAAPQYTMPWVYHVAATVKLSDDATAEPVVIDPAVSWQWLSPNDWRNLQNDDRAILYFSSRERYVPSPATLEKARKIYQPEDGAEPLDPSTLELNDESFDGLPANATLQEIIERDVGEIKSWADDYVQNPPPNDHDPYFGTYWKYLVSLRS